MYLPIRYNSPVILTFSLLAVAIQLVTSTVAPGFTARWFALGASLDWQSVGDWWRLFSHVLGHGSWHRLFANMALLLLLGPILEQKYGHGRLLLLIAATAVVTGLINVVFSSTGIYGASGVVFMLLALVAMVDIRRGELPLTFVLVAILFVGYEFLGLLGMDRVSQFVHVFGAAVGVAAGLIFRR